MGTGRRYKPVGADLHRRCSHLARLRRRAAQEQERTRADDQRERILDAARKEFAAKDDVGGLKSDLIGIGVIGAAIAALVAWDKISGGKDGA